VRGEDGLDEITLSGKTIVYAASPGGVERIEVTPEDFGLRRSSLENLRGGSAGENASIIREVLEGRRKDAARDLVLINAAASLRVAGAADDLRHAVELAAQSIETGAALAKLQALRHLTQGASKV
jgi:anthranilate phosphoribosyltransferase